MRPEELFVGYKYIPGYDGLYSIDKSGNVYSHLNGIVLKPTVDGRGYSIVTLYKNKTPKRRAVHRLVAITHIPNPNNLPEIDHIDTNKLNNNVSNLRWCTRKENCNNPLTLKHLGDSRRGEKCCWYGKKRPREIVEKFSLTMKGHPVSKETREKIGNANRGLIRTPEVRKMMSLARIGKRMGKDNSVARPVSQYSKDGVLIKKWDCISDVTRSLGIGVTSICNCIAGRSKSSGGYIWK